MKFLVHGAQLQCNQGTAPAKLVVLPNVADVSASTMATAQDFVPMTNIQPFGLCRCPANPQVAAATAVHLGVLTPMPCIPQVTAPWQAASGVVNMQGVPVLTDSSTCMCQWGGTIQPADAGQDIAKVE